jgi:hypothetical protein
MALGASEDDHDAGMAGGALAGLDLEGDDPPCGDWPAELTARRRTYDPDSGAPAPQCPSSGALSVKKQHRRVGSGGLLAGIAGPSNRVQPCAAWAVEDGDETDQA